MGLLPAADYERVRSLFERPRRGLPTPVADLLTPEDFDVLDADRDQAADGFLESWRQ
jgi:hypothetical protein